MALKGKAGAMSEAIEEEKEEKAEGESAAEEKAEGKKGEKKEEKSEPKKEEKKEKGKGKKSKAHTIVVHNHKAGHNMHSLHEDGSNQMHQFALGDHAAMASKMAELTGGEEGQEMGGEPEGAPAQ